MKLPDTEQETVAVSAKAGEAGISNDAATIVMPVINAGIFFERARISVTRLNTMFSNFVMTFQFCINITKLRNSATDTLKVLF